VSRCGRLPRTGTRFKLTNGGSLCRRPMRSRLRKNW
jgi:hypothetical protein